MDDDAALDGTGSEACPLRTLTAAIEALASGGTIHVAPGDYSEATGEVFPLLLGGAGVGSLTVAGSGAGSTTIRGLGDHIPPGFGGLRAAIVADTADAIVTLRDLAWVSPFASQRTDEVGLFCDSGNAPDAQDDPLPPANLVLDGVLVRGFAGGVLLAGTQVSACNVDVRGSTFLGNTFGVNFLDRDSLSRRPSGRIGALGGGNQFSDHRVAPSLPVYGVGIYLQGAAPLVIEGNTFLNNDLGVSFGQFYEGPSDLRVVDNDFIGNSVVGLAAYYDVQLAEVSNNLFEGHRSGEAMPALALTVDGVLTNYAPAIQLARGNIFNDNDAGVLLQGTTVAEVDFGRAGDVGANLFFCNGSGAAATTLIGDLVVIVDEPALEVFFRGNAWDHVPPSSGLLGATAPDTDVVTIANAPSVDVAGATLVGAPYTPCP